MDLIEQARKKFKIGTVFSNLNLDCGRENIKITNPVYREKSDRISVDVSNHSHWYTIYDKRTDKWATIHNKQNYELWEK